MFSINHDGDGEGVDVPWGGEVRSQNGPLARIHDRVEDSCSTP